MVGMELIKCYSVLCAQYSTTVQYTFFFLIDALRYTLIIPSTSSHRCYNLLLSCSQGEAVPLVLRVEILELFVTKTSNPQPLFSIVQPWVKTYLILMKNSMLFYLTNLKVFLPTKTAGVGSNV